MSKEQTVTKFEFILTLENNIVCQRIFNVINYNQKSKKSLEFYEMVKYISEDITDDLKNKNAEYLLENKNFFFSDDFIDDVNQKTNDDFVLRIKNGDEILMERCFPSYYFYSKVRYSVDIRPKLKHYLGELSRVLSLNKYKTKYLKYSLV